MVSEKSKQAVAPWLPMIFCAVLSLITLISQVVLMWINGADSSGWATSFVGFLPMCFFFVGAAVAQLRKEILELRAQVVELQGQQAR